MVFKRSAMHLPAVYNTRSGYFGVRRHSAHGGLRVNSNIGVLLMHLYLLMAEICFMWLFLGRIAVLRMQMRSTVTDRVAWSVGLSVCHTGEPCKNG